MVGLESEVGQLGPGVGCLEVEKIERKLWKEKHKFNPDINKAVFCWGQRHRGQGPMLRRRGG